MKALDGNDHLSGGPGHDGGEKPDGSLIELEADEGNDVVAGEGGSDDMEGDEGNDQLYGGPGGR